MEEKQNFMRDYPNSSFVETLSSLDKNLKSDLAKKKLEESIQNKKVKNAQAYVSQVQSPEDKAYYQAKVYDSQKNRTWREKSMKIIAECKVQRLCKSAIRKLLVCKKRLEKSE
ncbi:hypothetical protein M1L82_00005, partial [Fusobacterium necrophorum]